MNLSDLRQDARFTMRLVRRQPGFYSAVVATLALGIGATVAVFGITNAVLLKPLPYAEPSRLFLLRGTSQKSANAQYSYLDFLDAKRNTRSFEGMAAWRSHSYVLSGIGEPEYVQARQATAGFLDVLGIKPHLGREFSSDEDRPGGDPVALITYEIWQQRFSGQPAALGARIVLNGKPHTVVGVLPAQFDLLGTVPLYTPLGQHDDVSMRGRQFRPGIWTVVRLADDTGIVDADAELTALSRELSARFPATNAHWQFTIVPLRDVIVGDIDRTLLLLGGAVGLLLLIACANVANLCLARSAGRSQEFAVRAALGAGRGQLARQIITESVGISLAGGVIGLAAGAAAVRLASASVTTGIPRLSHFSIDARVFLFTLIASTVTGLAVGVALALLQEHGGLAPVTHGTRSVSARLRRTQAGLVAAQVALAFVLLAGSGVMLRSIVQLLSVDMGFDPGNVLTTGVGLSPAVTSNPARIRTVWKEILARASAIPGVEAAAINISLPLQGEESVPYSTRPAAASGAPQRSGRIGTPTVGYWSTMRIPLVRGRVFTDQDGANAPRVVVVDELLAARAFPGEDPIGKELYLPLGPARIVGVVRHLRYSALDEDVTGRANEQLYIPFDQLPDQLLRPLAPGMRLVLRTSVSPSSIEASLRHAVLGTGLDQPVHHLATMEQVVGGTLAERRLVLTVLGTFAGLALGLACIGIAGVVSYTMNRRLREIGIRIALGARQREVLALALGQGMSMVLLGVSVGVVAWLTVMRVVRAWLYKVAPADPGTLVAVAALLSAVALVAIYLPSRRSAHIDPVDVLRHE